MWSFGEAVCNHMTPGTVMHLLITFCAAALNEWMCVVSHDDLIANRYDRSFFPHQQLGSALCQQNINTDLLVMNHRFGRPNVWKQNWQLKQSLFDLSWTSVGVKQPKHDDAMMKSPVWTWQMLRTAVQQETTQYRLQKGWTFFKLELESHLGCVKVADWVLYKLMCIKSKISNSCWHNSFKFYNITHCFGVLGSRICESVSDWSFALSNTSHVVLTQSDLTFLVLFSKLFPKFPAVFANRFHRL